MIAIYFMQWWYTQGWGELAKRCGRGLRTILRTFSVPILLRTLFSPWKRVISYGDRSLNERLRSMVDNLVSRVVGFGVRLLALLAAAVSLVVFGVVTLVTVVLWPFLPILSLALLARGLVLW